MEYFVTFKLEKSNEKAIFKLTLLVLVVLMLRLVNLSKSHEGIKSDTSFICNQYYKRKTLFSIKKGWRYIFLKQQCQVDLIIWWWLMFIDLRLIIWISLRYVKSLLTIKNRAGHCSRNLIDNVKLSVLVLTMKSTL